MRQNTIIFFTSLLFIFCPLTNHASAVDNGKTLHEENCQSCHQPGIYSSKDRMVKSFAELSERVKQCELMNDLLWFEEEVNDVISYLNRNYYFFNK